MRRLVILIFFGAVACGPPSIESLCDDVARTQCEQCYSCGDLDGADLCGVPGDQEDCVQSLADACAGQAATLERPKHDIRTCDESLEELTCDTLVGAMAQDTPSTTSQCAYFL